MLDDRLEYIITSLPNLRFDAANEVRQKVEVILRQYSGNGSSSKKLTNILDEEAAKFLSENECLLFQNIQLDQIYKTDFQNSSWRLLSHFSAFDDALRMQLSQLRQARLQNNQHTAEMEKSIGINKGSPLEEELQLMRIRWDKIEELEAGHFTDIDALTAYKLKLLILIRQWSFDQLKGMSIFQQTTNAANVWPINS